MSRKTLDDISVHCCPHHLSGLSSLRLVPLLLSVLLSFPPLPWPPSWSWCQESVHGSLTPLWSLTWTGQPSWCCASVWNLRGRMYCGNALRSTICVYWGQTVQTGFLSHVRSQMQHRTQLSNITSSSRSPWPCPWHPGVWQPGRWRGPSGWLWREHLRCSGGPPG